MMLGCKTPDDVIKAIKDQGVEMVDLRFTDLPGMWQHTSFPAGAIDVEAVDEGLGFDGSSIRGFQEIHASDMLLMPDEKTAFIDPFCAHKTLVLICDVRDPVTKEYYSRDPRGVARKAEEHLNSTGIGTRAFFGPEAEFFVFDDVRYGQDVNFGTYFIDSVEGPLEHGRGRGPQPRAQDPAQGGLLPGAALGHAHGHPRRDGADHGADRHRGRVPPPRGRDRRPVRDRHEVRYAGRHGRQADQVQVRGQERGARSTARPRPSCPSRCSATTARACTCTSRSGTATSRSSAIPPAMAACRRPGATTSAAS